MLPEYETAALRAFKEAVDTMMRARDELLASMPRAVSADHIPDAPTDPEHSGGYQGPIVEIGGSFVLEVKAAMESDVSAWLAAASDCADSALPRMMQMIFSTLEAATKQAGNVVDGGGGPPSWDLILDAIEKMELDFEPDGTPKRLVFVTSPELAERLPPITEAQTQRHQSIIKAKWEQFLARRRVRKLDK